MCDHPVQLPFCLLLSLLGSHSLCSVHEVQIVRMVVSLDPGLEAGISTREHAKPPWPLIGLWVHVTQGSKHNKSWIRVKASSTCSFPLNLIWGGCELKHLCIAAWGLGVKGTQRTAEPKDAMKQSLRTQCDP